MKTDDYVLVLAKQLTSSLSKNKSFDFLSGWSDLQVFEFAALSVPLKRSVGFAFEGHSAVSLKQAIEQMREWSIGQIVIGEMSSAVPQLPERIAASFANTSTRILQIQTSEKLHSFGVRVEFSSRYKITFAQLAAFVDAQDCAKLIWTYLNKTVGDSFKLNKINVEIDDLKSLFMNPLQNVIPLLEMNLESYISEIQIECKLSGCQIKIPATLKDCFTLTQPQPKPRISFNHQAPLSPKIFLDFLDGQKNQSAIKKYTESELAYNTDENEPKTFRQFRDVLSKADQTQLSNYFGFMIMIIVDRATLESGDEINFTSGADLAFKPISFKHEDPRAQARSEHHDEPRWQLKPNDQSWQNYLLAEGQLPQILISNKSYEQTKTEYSNRLKQAFLFATKVKSNFAEAFKLAMFILEDTDLKSSVNTFEDFKKLLTEKFFSEISIRASESIFTVLQDFRAMRLSFQSARDFASYGFTSLLFGGMGSWNDQSFANDLEQKEYEVVSSQLYRSLSEFFIATANQE